MKLTRRSTLWLMLVGLAQSLLPKSVFARTDDIRHILPSVTATGISVSVSTLASRARLDLMVGDLRVPGVRRDSHGRYWSFSAEELAPETEYSLQLLDEHGALGSPWPLRTFPDATTMPERFRLLAFTCAGGADGFGIPGKQLFKPHAFRRNLFDAALAEKPDAAVAIGDHIYWDLRGGGMPPIGRRSKLIKLLAGWYLRFMYGEFDRTKPILGTENDAVLTAIGDEQIADLYGTRFKSTPMFFVSDDHDYFENDDAEEDLVTFPANAFSKAAFRAVASLYYPPLPDGPSAATDRAFGLLRYGRLFEGALFDCAGHLTLGEEAAGLVPPEVELWLRERARNSPAAHFALVPSHPMGWTAGKWREWYPDVVAPKGYEGVVQVELMADVGDGRVTTDAQKYLWQSGWWSQHQRLLQTLSQRAGHRLIFSGDIHAQGAVNILASGSVEPLPSPVQSILVGPVGTSDMTWASAARGVTASTPDWLTTEDIVPTREVNGFTLLEFTPEGASVRLADCGGYDRSLGEDGGIRAVDEFKVSPVAG